MKNIISLPFLNKLENKIGSWIFKNNSKYWFAEHSVARNVEGKSRTERCFRWPRFWAYGLLPTLAVVLTQLDDSTASGSQLHRRAHSAHLHSLCYHRRENWHWGTNSHPGSKSLQTRRTQTYTPRGLILQHVSSKTILFRKYHGVYILSISVLERLCKY